MIGYSTYGLIICPTIETYINKEPEYKRLLKKSVENAIKFLHMKKIRPAFLKMDYVALDLNISGINWFQTTTEADTIFVDDYCKPIHTQTADDVKFLDIYKMVEESKAASYETDTSSDPDEYLIGINKRIEKITHEILERQLVIFNIFTPNRAAYNIKPKAGSPRILINVHNGTFVPTTYLGDMQMNPISLLEYDMGNRPLYEWRF